MKPTMRSMTSNMLQAPPGLSSLCAQPQKQERPEVKVQHSFKALSGKDNEEQDEDHTESSTSSVGTPSYSPQ